VTTCIRERPSTPWECVSPQFTDGAGVTYRISPRVSPAALMGVAAAAPGRVRSRAAEQPNLRVPQ